MLKSGARAARRQSDTAERDAAFRRAIDEANSRHNILDVALAVGAGKLERSGQNAKKTLCIFHNEKTASLHLYPGENNFHCFGCGSNGDAIQLVMQGKGVAFLPAVEFLLGSTGLPIFDPVERAKIIEVETAERLRAIADARRFFALAQPVTANDPGGRYLAARGLQLPDYAGTVRFSMIPSWQDPETGEWGSKLRPALVCGCQDETGSFTAVQRIFVDGPAPDKAACKLSLGSLKGAALRLGPPQGEIITAEGPEDGMSIAQEEPGASVWIPCGTGLWGHMRFPPEVHSIVLAGQNDPPGRQAIFGTEAKPGVESLFLERGYSVNTVFPPRDHKDWNVFIRAKAY